jgi:hypothetical protein
MGNLNQTMPRRCCRISAIGESTPFYREPSQLMGVASEPLFVFEGLTKPRNPPVSGWRVYRKAGFQKIVLDSACGITPATLTEGNSKKCWTSKPRRYNINLAIFASEFVSVSIKHS